MFITTAGHRMHVVEAGQGEPAIVLLHGIPANAQLWRDVVPRLAPHARVIAPDLLGFGESDHPSDVTYDLPTHAAHLRGVLEALGVTRYVLVGMDLGLLVGLHHASQHPEQIAGLVLFEGLFLPMDFTMPALGFRARFFQWLLSLDWVADRLLADAKMARTFLTDGVVRTLSEAELERYLAPLRAPGHLRRLWIDGVGPRQLAAHSTRPGDAVALINQSAAWLQASTVPCLLLTATPGSAVNAAIVAEARRRLPRLQVRELGPGKHFLPEDQPEALAREVLAFHASVR